MALWSVNGTDVSGFTEEERAFDEMTLNWQASKSDVQNVLRPSFDGSGKYEVVPRYDGGFDVEDRSGGRSSVDLRTSRPDSDVRPISGWFVEEYEEGQVGTGGGRWDVEMTVVPEKEKSAANEYNTISGSSLTKASDEWKFTADIGDVVTDTVAIEVNRTPEGEVEGVELSMFLFSDEVRVFEESFSKINAVNYRDVPDGTDLIEDTNENSRNTVTINPPDGGDVSVTQGDYVVRSWSTVWNSQFYQFTMEVYKV